jgi:hypothetical protein
LLTELEQKLAPIFGIQDPIEVEGLYFYRERGCAILYHALENFDCQKGIGMINHNSGVIILYRQI